jgi:flagellar motor switch/type III secretory pathway protein FliN
LGEQNNRARNRANDPPGVLAELFASGKLTARGEVVVVGGIHGPKVSEVVQAGKGSASHSG